MLSGFAGSLSRGPTRTTRELRRDEEAAQLRIKELETALSDAKSSAATATAELENTKNNFANLKEEVETLDKRCASMAKIIENQGISSVSGNMLQVDATPRDLADVLPGLAMAEENLQKLCTKLETSALFFEESVRNLTCVEKV